MRSGSQALIDLVLGEAVAGQQARAEVAVDHAHRRIAEHQGQHALAADLGDDRFRRSPALPA